MIVFCHLLNDRSGSPVVLRAVLDSLNARECGLLYIGSQGRGALDDVNMPTRRYWYRRSRYRLLTLFAYIASQVALYRALSRARDIPADATIFVNTLLPFGAALYGWRTERRVVYHLHEVSISPAPLHWLLVAIARFSASALIYVSSFHRQRLPIRNVPSHTIHNAIQVELLRHAEHSFYQPRRDGAFTVLMLASLRDYKGIPEFLSLATRLVNNLDIRFELVCNESKSGVNRYFTDKVVPPNVALFSRTARPEDYYARASLVVNLSRPNQCVETFGLTLLEAMAFGVPVIAPPVGGPAEIVSQGVEGYLISSYEVEKIADLIVQLANDEDRCLELSKNAKARAKSFTPQEFEKKIKDLLGV